MSKSQNKFANFTPLSWKLTVNVVLMTMLTTQHDSANDRRLGQHALQMTGPHIDCEYRQCILLHCSMQLTRPTSITDQPKILCKAPANGAGSQASQGHVLSTESRGSLECWCLYRTAEQRLRWNLPRTHIAAYRHSQAASNTTVSLRKGAVLLLSMMCCLKHAIIHDADIKLM